MQMYDYDERETVCDCDAIECPYCGYENILEDSLDDSSLEELLDNTMVYRECQGCGEEMELCIESSSVYDSDKMRTLEYLRYSLN